MSSEILDAGCWMLDAGCWMLDTGCWILDAKIGNRIACRVDMNETTEDTDYIL